MNTFLAIQRMQCAGLMSILFAVICVSVSAQETKVVFEELATRKANAEIVQLWMKRPYESLPTIDSYLEGSLKLVEASESPDLALINSMHAKAMAGARAADEAFDSVVFSEYASSFIGWNRDQQHQFRAGQKAYGDAKAALQAKRFDAALAAGQDCVAKAQPLGDWWGTAMGYSAMGAAHKELGARDKALTAFTSSRAIYHDLRLGGAELNCTVEMVSLLQQGDSPARTKVTCQQGIALAETLNDDAAKTQLSQVLTSLE